MIPFSGGDVRTLTATSWAAAIAFGIVVGYGTFEARAAQDKPVAPNQAARPQRTEAEARALAEKHRQERAEQRKQTGKPVELISELRPGQMQPVPASLGVDPFYTKYVDAQGIPVISSDKVPDEALLVARDIINSMLAMRPDLRKAMIARKWRTGVIAEVEMTMDIPEYSRMKRPGAPRDEPVKQADRDYHANRSRGLGGNPTTGAEENLLGYPGHALLRRAHLRARVRARDHGRRHPGRRSEDARRDSRGLQGRDGRGQVRAPPTGASTTPPPTPASTGRRACSGGSSRTTASASPATSRSRRRRSSPPTIRR